MSPTRTIRRLRCRLASTLSATVLIAGCVLAVSLASAAPAAAADTDTYPWPSAPCEFSNGGSHCTNPSNSYDLYDWYLDENGDSTFTGNLCGSSSPSGECFDNFGYQYRNCTSYVAQKINQVFGKNISGWGNAANWKTSAVNAGYTTDPTSAPQIGDIAAWGTEKGGGFGHVAYVYAVNGSTASLDEYNVAGTGAFTSDRTTTSNSAGTPDWYIHTGTTATSGGGGSPNPGGSGSYASSTQGTVQGDFNDDGHTDLATFYNYPSNETGLFVFYGNGQGGLNPPVQVWDSGPGQWNALSIKPFVGDFNHDGKSDIGLFYDYGNSTTNLFVFTSLGTTFSSPVSVWSSGAGNWNWNSMQVAAGDFTDDGNTDVAVMYDYGNSLTNIFLFTGNGAGGFNSPTGAWTSGPGNWTASSTKIVAGDVNGDGKTDLIALYDYGNSETGLFAFFSHGSTFANPVGQWNSGPGNWTWSASMPVAGDFNGDGKTDLGVVYGYPNSQTKIWTFTATAAGGLNAPTVAWDSGPNAWSQSSVTPFVGDYDSDSRADIGAIYAYPNSQTGVFLFTSGGSAFSNPSLAWESGTGQWTGSDVLVS